MNVPLLDSSTHATAHDIYELFPSASKLRVGKAQPCSQSHVQLFVACSTRWKAGHGTGNEAGKRPAWKQGYCMHTRRRQGRQVDDKGATRDKWAMINLLVGTRSDNGMVSPILGALGFYTLGLSSPCCRVYLCHWASCSTICVLVKMYTWTRYDVRMYLPCVSS